MDIPCSPYDSPSYNTVLSSGTPSSTSASTSSRPKTMKIAIAGTNGFAQFLAYHIQTTTPFQFMLLSKRENKELSERKHWQIIKTRYIADPDLEYLLTGVNVVMSTIAGQEQIALIDAAANAGVERFVPSEFGASPWIRTNDEPTDNDRRRALLRLEELERQGRLRFTVFTCGLFYERFGPGGPGTWHINVNGSLGGEGGLLVDIRHRAARIPIVQGRSIYVTMVSANDAARYVVAALFVQDWPKQLTFQGDQLSLRELVNTCQRVRGGPFQCFTFDIHTLFTRLDQAVLTQGRTSAEAVYYSQMLSIAQAEFELPADDFRTSNLNMMISVDCERFEAWLTKAWADTE